MSHLNSAMRSFVDFSVIKTIRLHISQKSLSWEVHAIIQVIIQDEVTRVRPIEPKYNFLELFLRWYGYRICYFSRIIQKHSCFTSLAALLM